MLREKMNTALEFVRDYKGVRTQKEFASAIGMPADRLRNIANGKIQRLQPDEAMAIQRAFGIRNTWWFSESAPMLLTEGEQAIQPLLNELGSATAEVLALGLDSRRATFVQQLLFNVRTKNAKALDEQLEGLSTNTEPARIPPDEHVLIEAYRHCNAEAKRSLIQAAALLSAGLSPGRGDSVVQTISAAVGGSVAGRDVNEAAAPRPVRRSSAK